MKNTIPEVDTYIEKSADFAQPILKKIRRTFHKACPQIQEAIKWGCPHFEYQGLVGGMAAFKKHASLGFWKPDLMSDPENLFQDERQGSMCGLKFRDVFELPAEKTLIAYIREAVKLNENNVTRSPTKKKIKEFAVPDELMHALKKNKKAMKVFENFSPSNRREYADWITEAKREAKREKRIATAVEWISAGKPRNWKYMK